jgi:hypothetical protein
MFEIISAFLYLYLVITKFIQQYPPLGSSTVGSRDVEGWDTNTTVVYKEELKGKITGKRDSKTPNGQRGENFRINAAEPERRRKSKKKKRKKRR